MPPVDPYAAFRETVEAALRKKDMTKQQLAESLNVSPSVITKLLLGQTLQTTKALYERLRRIEDKLDIPTGTLRHLIEPVEEHSTTQEAIQRDRWLPAAVKDAMVVVVDHYTGRGTADNVTELDTQRRGPGKNAAPKKAAKTGEPPAVPDPEQAKLAQHVKKRRPKKE